MKTQLNTMKQELKAEGKALRELKDESKEYQRKNYGAHSYQIYGNLVDNKREFRHKHIAYCEMRGTPRHKIEQPRDGNEPSDTRIQHYKDLYVEVEEAA